MQKVVPGSLAGYLVRGTDGRALRLMACRPCLIGLLMTVMVRLGAPRVDDRVERNVDKHPSLLRAAKLDKLS